MRKVICLLLTTAFLGTTAMDARNNAIAAVPTGQASTERQTNLKQKILEVPPGTMIQVRLLNKQKIRDKLGQIDDEGFNLTAVEQGQIVTKKIAFNEMKSFKQVTSAKTKAGHTALYILAGIGVAVLVVAILFAAQED